jgi:hypothetical protein
VRVAPTRRWITAWLVAAAVLAALLLANAVRDYLFVWRILAAQQVRHQMAQYVATLEQSLRRQATPAVVPPELLEAEAAPPPEGTAWIEVRRSDGGVLARRGEPGSRTFTPEEETLHFRSHEPLARIVPHTGGELVVQAFSVYNGRRAAAGPAPAPAAATSAPATPPGTRPFLVVEIAAPLAIRDTSVLWPIRRNLLVNSASALALFATVVVAGLGFRSYERGRRLESQLEIARAVQSKLLPSRTNDSEPVRTSAVYRPAEQVGGDFYDVFRTSAGAVALVIGDVSGKGVPAALLTGVIHGAVRSAAWSGSAEEQERESARLNRLLCANSSGNRFASMFWCYYDAPARCLHYVNAGHCPPVLVRGGGSGVAVSALDEGGPVLGLLAEATYRQARREVCPGDLLVLYSDGLVECTNAAGEEYGESRLHALLRDAAGKDPDAIRRSVTDSVAQFLGAGAPRDDLTLVVAQFA